jgi:DNA-binding NarL/FixJ family response regulator
MSQAEPDAPIRVIIVDDQALVREGFKRLLEMEPGIAIVATASDGAEAMQIVGTLAAQHRLPHVALMDVRMPVLDGIAATELLRQEYPSVRVVMLTTFDDEEFVVRGMRAGARGYLLKDATLQSLIEAIRTAHRGDLYLQPSVFARLMDRVGSDPAPAAAITALPRAGDASTLPGDLTEREREILVLLARGASNREISEQLFITEGTVKNHVSNILSKLGLRDRTQAAIFAREHGFLQG